MTDDGGSGRPRVRPRGGGAVGGPSAGATTAHAPAHGPGDRGLGAARTSPGTSPGTGPGGAGAHGPSPRPEAPEDAHEVEALFDLSFAPGRAALSSYRLRGGVPPVAALGRVIRAAPSEGGAVAGAIRFWPVHVGRWPALLLGPVAVHPTRQGEGLGALLIEEGLAAATLAGWRRVMLVGDVPYYGRFGFARLAGVEMPPPTNPERVLGRALAPGAWEGVAGRAARWTPGPTLDDDP